MRKLLRQIIIFSISIFVLSGCRNDEVDLTDTLYNPVPFTVSIPDGYPIFEVPADNPLTVDGVALGRRLFYDTILSADGSLSCGSCHNQQLSFTDGLSVSPGVDGLTGSRSSMSLLDVGFSTRGLFWDGRVGTLEEQALLPVEDPIELHNSWPDVIEKFRAHEEYPELFRKAFGIENDSEITKELAGMAIAQFERTLVSSGNSKYDRVLAARDIFTEEEQIGFEIYFKEGMTGLPDGQCFHCHGGPLLTNNDFVNNGLDSVSSYLDFADPGRGAVLGISEQNGKFRTPTLRNIAQSAPYMHDGRFQTLEEVMDHYTSGGQPSIGKNGLIDSIFLDESQKAAVVAFLKTLTDTDFMNNPAYEDPN